MNTARIMKTTFAQGCAATAIDAHFATFLMNTREKHEKLCTSFKEMEMNLTQLCDLDPMNHDTKILVRCISIWKSHPLGKPNEVWSLDAILQDQQGKRVQVSIKGKHISKFQLIPDEGACY
ncbi:replication protein A 70 kDa DNA-binding subunit B [Tanacetum coccineum]